MKSTELLSAFKMLRPKITKVTADSREVMAGTVFVAVRGVSQDGHQFIKKAHESGAIMIIGEEPCKENIGYIQVKDSKKALGDLAAEFYGHPSQYMKMIGVTGTSGKTTTTYLIESILIAAGHKVGVLGTINFRIGETVLPSTHTTPGAVELQELLARMRKAGCTAVVMEVSSHALKQKRTAAVSFDGVVFTNLTPEHLDFHPDMDDYFESKAILFKEQLRESKRAGKNPFATANADDPYGQRLIQETGAKPFQLTGQITTSLTGIHGSYQGVKFESSLIGGFNASNILAAMSVTLGIGIGPKEVQEGVENLKNVPGRLESIKQAGRTVLVDYAHKPDALEKVLKVLSELKGQHHLYTVFGCGGDRDRSKRPVMGKHAVKLSDYVVITSDNPRGENPQAIVDEILVGTAGYQNFSVELDRKKAIIAAIERSKPGDLILVAGKGHEDYQIVQGAKIHFDDREIAREALQNLDTRF